MQARLSQSLPRCLHLSLILTLALTAATPLVQAKDGRDFSGYYAVSNPQEVGGNVKFTLTVQLFNYSDADVKQPVVALLESRPGGSSMGAFPAIKLMPKKLDITVAQQFSVSKLEYDRWLSGLAPTVVVLNKDVSGRTLQRGVQLSRRPALPPPGN